MVENREKRVIDLNPMRVKDETLDALEAEVRSQTDEDIPEIAFFDTVVLDSRSDGGLDSHATIFFNNDTNE